jgi:hypothetical protein
MCGTGSCFASFAPAPFLVVQFGAASLIPTSQACTLMASPEHRCLADPLLLLHPPAGQLCDTPPVGV